MDPKLLEQFMAFQSFLAAQAAANDAQTPKPATPSVKPTSPEARVAQHLQKRQADAEDGEVVSQAASKVAAQQKLSGPTLTITPKPQQPEGTIDGTDGGPSVPLADFPTHLTLHWGDGTTTMLTFGQAKVRDSSGKPGSDARGQVARGKLKFQVGVNYTRIHKG